MFSGFSPNSTHRFNNQQYQHIMNPSIIKQIHAVREEVLSANGISFPRVVARFTELGVKRYHVDFVAGTVTSYVGHGADVATVPLEKIETESAWNAENIKEAIQLCLEVRAERGMPLTVETLAVEVPL